MKDQPCQIVLNVNVLPEKTWPEILFVRNAAETVLTVIMKNVHNAYLALQESIGMETCAMTAIGIAENAKVSPSMNVQCVIQNIITMATEAACKLVNGRFIL